METSYPIALKFGTQKGGGRAHLCTTFDLITINTRRVICDYSRKITLICCAAHRVNQKWQKVSLLWLERNQGKDHKDTVKKQQVKNSAKLIVTQWRVYLG